MRFSRVLIVAFITLNIASCSTAPKEPEVTPDGLVEVLGTEVDKLYRLPEADLGEYSEFGLAPCTVAFRKHWQRDQNNSRMDFSHRVTQEDVDRIKDGLAAYCDTLFREELLQDPAYTLVDDFDDGQNVLVIKPSIVNLDVNAPDVRSASMMRSYTTSAGEMTLNLELVDGTTGQVLARVIDRQQDFDSGQMEWTTTASNSAEARRILRAWSKQLRAGLDNVLAN